MCHTPVTGSQPSWVHGFPSSVFNGMPGWHTPVLLQTSAPLQTFPSEQLVPAGTGVCVIAPVDGLHVSTVHGFPSSTATGVPALQLPAPSHVSLIVQAFPSLHAVPATAGVW
jgi:hypothetical protein